MVGVLDREGNVIIPLEYDRIICAKDGFIAKEHKYGGKWDDDNPIRCLFDKNGQMVMGPFEKMDEILDGETEINGEMYSFKTRINVSVPDSVTKIVGDAFYNCEDLESVSIGKNVSFISFNSFVECPELFSIIVDEENRSFFSENGVLYDKDKTTIIKFPARKSIDEFVIPESVKKITRCAFDGSSIKTIILPKGLTEIGDWAFFRCSLIKELEIPDSVTSIGSNAFDFCKSLESIKLPNILKSIQDYAFNGCRSLVNIQFPTALETIGESAFEGCTQLETIILPENLRKIGKWAFDYCSNLKSISLPNSVCEIGEDAFSGCTQLETIILPDNLRKIGGYAFRNCSNLKSISLPNSVCEIGESAFRDCTQLETIILPENLRKIGEWAFHNCSNLKSISLPNSACKIGEYAFSDCTQLETIIMPRTIQNWKDLFFPHWKKYSTNKILTTLETYEDIKFGIPSTVYVELLPESLENIRKGKYADSVIEELPISESDWNKYRDVILSNCKAIRTAFSGSKLLYSNERSYYRLPFNRFAIYGDYAFAHCEILKMDFFNGANDYAKKEAIRISSFTIPSSVQSIGKGAFMGCTLFVTVTIPESVTSIGDEAFKDCTNLKEVTIPKSISWLGRNTFEGCNSLTIVLMSRKLYQTSNCKFPELTEFLFYED